MLVCARADPGVLDALGWVWKSSSTASVTPACSEKGQYGRRHGDSQRRGARPEVRGTTSGVWLPTEVSKLPTQCRRWSRVSEGGSGRLRDAPARGNVRIASASPQLPGCEPMAPAVTRQPGPGSFLTGQEGSRVGVPRAALLSSSSVALMENLDGLVNSW